MASKYNSSVEWQKDSNYIIRCLEANFGPSNAGNPMITFKYEVASPEFMEVAGEQFNIAGTKLTTWQVCRTMNGDEVDIEKTKKNAADLKRLYEAYGLPSDNINPENPETTGFVGKCVCALLYNDKDDQRKSPTAAQLAAGQKVGDVLLHPILKGTDGKPLPLKRNFPKIAEIFGLAPTNSSKPY